MVLETGLYGLLWHQNFPAYSSWTSQHSWIYHVCEFNYAREMIRLNIEHAELKPRREGDRSIMAEVYHHFNSAADLRAINRVRMLHGVVTISDITAADSRKLDHVFFCEERCLRGYEKRIYLALQASCFAVRLYIVETGQWNSCSHTIFNCLNLWATGSLLPIPNG